jgi:RNA polymerase sigma-70 factor (ECF subfamily)
LSESVRKVFEANAAYVWRTLRCMGVAERDLDDGCQEVFVVVHRKLDQFQPGTSLRAWIHAICLRVASAYRRRARVRFEAPVDPQPENTFVDTTGRQVDQTLARRELGRLLDRLDDDKRAVFVLYEIEQLTMKEVAAACGCPLQTAYSRLHAARDALAALVRHYERSEVTG